MSKLEELNSLLTHHGLLAKKSLGQNFLVDEKALHAIVSAANIHHEDPIVEVGPGTGFLTEGLVRSSTRVTSIELDPDMVGLLRSRFKKSNNLTLLHMDALDFDLEKSGLEDLKYKVVANIPYYITSPLIKHFLHSKVRPSVMVLLMQKEVAEKVCSLDGRSMITVETQVFGTAELVMQVPAKSFHPAPKVDSAVVRITAHSEPLVPADEMKDFMRIVKFGYSQKRKKLRSALAAGLHMKPAEVDEVLARAGIGLDLRAENLEIEDWRRLVDVLTK